MNPQDQPPEQPANQNSQPEPPTEQPLPPDHPQVVFMSRPMDPQKVHVSPEAMRRHEESKKKFPQLNLSEGEYIIAALDRHPIGLIQIWAAVSLVVALMVGVVLLLSSPSFLADMGSTSGESLSPMVLFIPVVLVSVLALIFGFIASSIYNANKFFLTNESVIQQIQMSLFSKREQTVSLSNIEDASFTQDGILPHLLNFGMIRLSTEGDETTYRFNYASSPQSAINTLNNAVEAFKNGRPVPG